MNLIEGQSTEFVHFVLDGNWITGCWREIRSDLTPVYPKWKRRWFYLKQNTYQKDQTQESGVSNKSVVKPVFMLKIRFFLLIRRKTMLLFNKCRSCEKKGGDIRITNTVNVIFGCSVERLETLGKVIIVSAFSLCSYSLKKPW